MSHFFQSVEKKNDQKNYSELKKKLSWNRSESHICVDRPSKPLENDQDLNLAMLRCGPSWNENRMFEWKKGCDEAIRSHGNLQADSIYEPRLNAHYPDVSFEYPAKKYQIVLCELKRNRERTKNSVMSEPLMDPLADRGM